MAQKKVPIMFTVEQYDMIEKSAKSVGLTVSSYIRMTVLEKIRVTDALDAQKRMVGMFQEMQQEMEMKKE